MCINDSIQQLADSVINTIKNQLKDLNSGFSMQTFFKTNDRVIFKLKIFDNLEAEVINVLNKNDTQKVLIKILNSSQTVWVDGNYLDAKLEISI